MATFANKCPHCGTQIALDIIAISQTRFGAEALFVFCTACEMPSVLLVQSMTTNLSDYALQGGTRAINGVCVWVGQSYPESKASDAPEHVPEKVARVFVQAREAEKRSHFDTAVMGYRKTIDVGLKAFAPDVTGDFGPRINKLADAGKLLPRSRIGATRSACSETKERTNSMSPHPRNVADLAGFVQSVLEYLFTMPSARGGSKSRRRSRQIQGVKRERHHAAAPSTGAVPRSRWR